VAPPLLLPSAPPPLALGACRALGRAVLPRPLLSICAHPPPTLETDAAVSSPSPNSLSNQWRETTPLMVLKAGRSSPAPSPLHSRSIKERAPSSLPPRAIFLSLSRFPLSLARRRPCLSRLAARRSSVDRAPSSAPQPDGLRSSLRPPPSPQAKPLPGQTPPPVELHSCA
jgi:hypothetical protein